MVKSVNTTLGGGSSAARHVISVTMMSHARDARPSTPHLLALAASRNLGALAALKRDGRPQLSMVNFALDRSVPATPTVRVSVVDGRAKVANLLRDPRGSLLVTSPDGWSYAVLEGDVEFSPVAAARGRRDGRRAGRAVPHHPRRGPLRLGRLPAGDGGRTAAGSCGCA